MKPEYFLVPLLFGALMQFACAERSASEGGDADHAAKPGLLTLANPGFEKPGGEQSVPGWRLFQHAGEPSYVMSLDAKSPGKGKQSLRLTQIHPQFYGLIEQDVTVAPEMVGKSLELSAMARTDKVGENGWVIWMYLYDSGEQLVADYESGPLVGTTKWQRIKVMGKVPPNTTKLKLGAQMKDQGNLGIGWLDDVKLRVIEPEVDTSP